MVHEWEDPSRASETLRDDLADEEIPLHGRLIRQARFRCRFLLLVANDALRGAPGRPMRVTPRPKTGFIGRLTYLTREATASSLPSARSITQRSG
jgi:hypothetical protein